MQQQIQLRIKEFYRPAVVAFLWSCGDKGLEDVDIFLFCSWTEISSESLSQSPGLKKWVNFQTLIDRCISDYLRLKGMEETYPDGTIDLAAIDHVIFNSGKV